MKIPNETWMTTKVALRSSVIEGKGMFAIEPIYKAEKVIVWGGVYVNKVKAEKAKQAGKLVMRWDEDLYSVEEKGDDPSYYINHSCDPNIWMTDAITLVAMRDIQPTDELTADYALWEADPNWSAKWDCKCGSSMCRKKITGNDWQLSSLQNKYRNHFSPLINKLISQQNVKK